MVEAAVDSKASKGTADYSVKFQPLPYFLKFVVAKK